MFFISLGDFDAIDDAIKFFIESEKVGGVLDMGCRVIDCFTPEKIYGPCVEYIDKVVGQKYEN